MSRSPHGAKPRKTAKKTANRPALIPQPNGRGALYAGGVPGNAGGIGRAPSAIRQRCRGSFDQRIPILEEIADGQPTERIRIPLLGVLKHVRCPKCQGQLKVTDQDAAPYVTVEVQVSAKAKERIAAIAKLGDIGMEAGRSDTEDVRARLLETVAAIQAELPPDEARKVLARIEPIWRAA